MDEHFDTAGERVGSLDRTSSGSGVPSGTGRPETAPELRLTVVENATGPNRGTIHPLGVTGLERMETWLSADASDFAELVAWR